MAEGLGGRTVLITGAAGGIGAACARRLVAAGARVLLADRDADRVESLGRELGQPSIAVDLTASADIERMVGAAYEHWGRLDVLFNNAGIAQAKPMLELTEADWDTMMSVNLRAAFFVTQACARRMIEQPTMPGSELRGKLIHTASVAAFRGGQGLLAHYSVTKAGVVSFMRTAAQVLAAHKVTSNAICPGVVDTAMWEKIDSDWTALEGWQKGEAWKRRTAGIPLGRPERAEDVTGLVLFLAGPDSDYITGQAMNVDGGLIMGG